MTCTADSEYIRAISVKYKRCPSSYSVRSAVARTGFEVKPLQRPKTAQQTVPSCALPRAQTARVQREKTHVLEELMFFYGRGVHHSFSFPVRESPSPERARTMPVTQSLEPMAAPVAAGSTFITDRSPLLQNVGASHAARSSAVSPWSCQNEALRQMFKASERRPRHRFFPPGRFLPKCTKT